MVGLTRYLLARKVWVTARSQRLKRQVKQTFLASKWNQSANESNG